MSQPSGEARILIVEDDPLSREFLTELLEAEGYEVEAVSDAPAAWARLRKGPPGIDAVLLDWVLPGMSGFALLQELKNSSGFESIPVILQTALSDRETMYKGIEAGAFYYVTKPIDQKLLLTVVQAAVADYAEWCALKDALNQENQAVRSLEEGVFRIRTVAEAAALAALLSQACPDPERTVIGLGEILLNAVEHGNLRVTYEEKSQLLEEGTWKAEIERRVSLPENRDKRVEVRFLRRGGEIIITVKDQGPGFDWRSYLTISPERLFHSHGRGIAMANLRSFDRLEFCDPGNCVTGFIDCHDGVE